MKKCLHISNDFTGSKVHSNLYNAVSGSFEQTIFLPVRKRDQVKKARELVSSFEGQLLVSDMLRPYHRILFRNKIKFLYRNLKPYLNENSFDVVHATMLFSDGALALRIFREYNIPYIVTVRGTDVNLFLKYRPDLFGLAKEIISNAYRVIFISQAHFSIFKKRTSGFIPVNELESRSRVIPNGINPFWLENIRGRKAADKDFNIIYIGKFNSNKNVLRLIEAVRMFRNTVPGVHLHLVGSGGSQEKKIIERSEHSDFIHFHGPVYDLSKLKELFGRSHVFAMVSKSETFGLVYVEALTQGVPIVYTSGQGIDGTFPFEVGAPANPMLVSSISRALKMVYENYETFDLSQIDFNRFHWPEIGKIYAALYTRAIEENNRLTKEATLKGTQTL